MHPHKHRIDLCNRALDAVRPVIPAELHRDVNEYINRFDEWGLGMELLIDQLTELDIKVTHEQFGLIREAMDLMDLGECDRLNYLRNHNLTT